jgi:sugar lactone lactonase YvrE
MNDGRCDRAAGRFWAGSRSYEGTPDRAALFRLDPDRSERPLVEGLWRSNGLDWSLDDCVWLALCGGGQVHRYTGAGGIFRVAPGSTGQPSVSVAA